MNNSVPTNYAYKYLNYISKPKLDAFSLPDSIGNLPRIKMQLPEISFSLANVEILI